MSGNPITRLIPAAFVAVLIFTSQSAHAQYLGLNLTGDMGVKSGSQPGPGIYVSFPLYYRADYDDFRDSTGRERLRNLGIGINVFTVPAVAVVTKSKLLGATYGFQVVPAVMNQRLSLASETAPEKDTGYGFADMYIQPVNLGWRTARADILGAYGFYAPTGTDDQTLDMWAHEIVAGTTLYLDSAKQWHVATTGSYDINQRKRSTDIKVGQILTLEGGAGRSFLKGAAAAGVAYLAQWKMTRDSGSDIPPRLPVTKGRVFGVGPDVTMPIFAKGKSVGLISFRYIFELGAKTNFEGQTLLFSFTFARLME